MNFLPQIRSSDSDLVESEARPAAGGQADRLDVRPMVAAFRRRIRLFCGVAGGVFLLAVIPAFLATPTYTATSRVMLNTRQQHAAPQDTKEVLGQLPSDSDQVDSEVQLIGSRHIAENVVAQLHLDSDPEFNGSTAVKEKSGIKAAIERFFPAKEKTTPAVGPSQQTVTIENVARALTASRVGTTSAIDISFTSGDAAKAATIANAFADAYTHDQLQTKLSANKDASGWLSSKIGELRNQAQADQARLQQYRIQHNLLATSGEGNSDPGAAISAQEISTYNQQVGEARAQLAMDQAALNTAKEQLSHGSKGDDLGEALGSPVIGGLRAQRAAISAKVADLSSRFGPKHPQLIEAQQQLADVDAQIQTEINRLVSNLQAKLNISANRLRSLEGTLGTAKSSLVQNNAAMATLSALQQAAEVSRQNYQDYLTRYNQIGALSGMQAADARQITEATASSVRATPNKLLNGLLGVLLGVTLGAGAVLLANALDASIITVEDAEKRLGVPCLGSIPLSSSIRPIGRRRPIDAVVLNPWSAFAEAFRGLRASMGYGGLDRSEPQVVMLTSALPNEGKTTASICLARSAALAGSRVILVDCDLRQRGVSVQLKAPTGRPGIAEVLQGRALLDEALFRDPETDMMVLPVAQLRLTAEQAFGTDRFDALISSLRSRFELVILDSPPVLAIADARMIAPKADALIMLARWRKTPEHAIRSALKLLPVSPSQQLGVALSCVDIRKQARYGYGDPTYYYKQYEKYYSDPQVSEGGAFSAAGAFRRGRRT